MRRTRTGLPTRRSAARACWSSSRRTTSGTTSSDVVGRLRAAVPLADVLVVDDNSPDGTGDLADGLARGRPAGPRAAPGRQAGPRRGVLAGFGWGLERGYDVLVEMDADGSHQPEQLPDLLAALPGADLVLGSRWVPGGRSSTGRCAGGCSPGAATPTSGCVLGIGLRDATGGFRAFRRTHPGDARPRRTWPATGYCFQVDLAWRAVRRGFRVVEVPIAFVERELGSSKMSGDDRARGAVAGHRLGRRAPGSAGCARRRDGRR